MTRDKLSGPILAVLALMAASPALADPPIWRVQGPHATVTLIPTIPTAPADGRWRTPALQQAGASAQEMWFISSFGLPNPITAIRLLTTINTKGYLPDGQHLATRLSPDGRARLARVAARYNVSPDKLDRMTPWNAFISLSLAAGKKSGAGRGSPVEQYVIAAAPSGTPKRGFDNIEDDLKLLVATPEAEQVYDLEGLLKQLDDPALGRTYATAWEAGDLGWIERERDAKLKAAAPVTYQTMQVQPRRRWAGQIARLAQGDKAEVVMLDSTNFVGPNGLPALLRARGLKVEGP